MCDFRYLEIVFEILRDGNRSGTIIGDVKAQIHLPAQIGISQYGGGGGGVSVVLSLEN